MNKLVIATTAAVVVSVMHAGSAHAAPAWCKGASFGTSQYHLSDLSTTQLEKMIVTFAKATCAPTPEADANRAQIEAARQAWSKKLNMIDADWADAVAFASIEERDRLQMMMQVTDIATAHKRPWSSFDAIDQYLLIKDRAVAAIGGTYFVDALGGRLSELGRFQYVADCINGSRTGPVDWAMCQGDIAQLDHTKLATEIRTNTLYGGYEKMLVRLAIHELKPALVAHAAKIKKLLASDPGYVKVFEVADATRKEWVGRYKTDAALIALLTTMEDAIPTKSRKAFAGCEDRVWTAWKTAMAAVPAKAFEGMRDDLENGKTFKDFAMGPIMANPTVYLAAVAYNICLWQGQEESAAKSVLAAQIADALQHRPGFRGPRTATVSALMHAGIVFDDRDTKLGFGAGSGGGAPISFASGGSKSSGGSGEGVVSKLTPAGTMVTVEFKKHMVKQTSCSNWKATNRIVRIEKDGRLIYDSYCTSYSTEDVNLASKPVLADPRYLDGIKVGMHVDIKEGMAVVSWTKPGAAIPATVYGVPLK